MAGKILPYGLGSIVSVVSDGGVELARCRVEAMDGKGKVIGRFYFPSAVSDGSELQSQDSFLWIFGDLNIINGKWSVIGSNPLPQGSSSTHFQFLGGSSLGGYWITTYDAGLKRISEKKLHGETHPLLPKDSVRGAAFVEARLLQISDSRKSPLD